MELGSLSRLLLTKLATELRAETVVGRSDAAASLNAQGARSATGAIPQPLPARTNPATDAAPQSSSLSPTGRLVAQLLRANAGTDAAASVISTSQPIVDDAAIPQHIAQSLARVVTESGLFYESHLVEWFQGKRDLDSLLREPQARLPGSPDRTAEAGNGNEPRGGVSHVAKATAEAPLPLPNARGPGPDAHAATLDTHDRHPSIRAGEPPTDISSIETRTAAGEPRLGTEAARIARHQLDALAAEQIVWQGVLRAGEPGEIEIGREQHGAATASPEVWRARLALALPQLGKVEVAITLNTGNLSLAFHADDATRAALAQRSTSLQDALSAQALRVQGMQFLAPRSQAERTR